MPRGPGHGPRHPHPPPTPPSRPAAEQWRDSGDPLLQKDREGAFDAMKQLAAKMQARNGVVMHEAQEKQHAERLMKVADWWKQKFPMKTKIAIGALLGATGIAGVAFPALAGMATIAGIGALTWRGITTGMTGLLSGLGTFGYLKKRNYSPTVARRAGIFAGALGGVVSFLGGRLLGEYFAGKFATGGEVSFNPDPTRLTSLDLPISKGTRFIDVLNQQLYGERGALRGLTLSDEAKTQLNHLVNRSFAHRPDLTQDLYGIVPDTPPAVRDAFVEMIQKAPTEGIRFPTDIYANMRVLGTEDFLTQLRTSLPYYQEHLGKELKEQGGPQALIDALRKGFPGFFKMPRI